MELDLESQTACSQERHVQSAVRPAAPGVPHGNDLDALCLKASDDCKVALGIGRVGEQDRRTQDVADLLTSVLDDRGVSRPNSPASSLCDLLLQPLQSLDPVPPARQKAALSGDHASHEAADCGFLPPGPLPQLLSDLARWFHSPSITRPSRSAASRSEACRKCE